MSLKIIREINELRQEIRQFRKFQPDATVGFVPTMGYLHDGHASLLKRSAVENGLTVLSIFVNPLQFGPSEDLDRYPRDEARDLAVAESSGVNIVFFPSVQEMYPTKQHTTVHVADVTERLCGGSRPGHFDGVATVVVKLLNIVAPDRAYFGLKDAQQIAVVATMVRDLNMPVEIMPCPTVREPDGLALSSRNVYLSQEQRTQALVLSRSLGKVKGWIDEGMTGAELIRRLTEEIQQQPLADIDYVEAVTYPDMQPLDGQQPAHEANFPILVALAVRFGSTRLIDNILIEQPEGR